MVGMTSQPSQKPQMSVLRLLEQLPPPSVEPGPATAAPLPADRPVRWGILATGKIAGGFAENLALLPDAEIAAVAARRLEPAREFAARHGAGTSYGSYAELVADPDVDVVYVATPHALHHEHVLLALEAGKPVLCEKAFTLNEAQAVELVAAARERGLFLMEAMWMRCHPLVRRLQQLLGTGELGTVRQVRADLGFRVDAPETDRLLDPALGGGALLDMGVYPLTFADLFLGEPERVATAATLSGSGIDLDVALALGYAGGAVAALTASMTAPTPRSASIATDRGRIDVPAPFHHPGVATWTPIGGTEADAESFSEDVIGTGLAHEAVEVMRCLRSGETESPLVPLETTVAMMRLLDRVRRDIGLRYAADVD
jgi:predicted dehydrogenase